MIFNLFQQNKWLRRFVYAVAVVVALWVIAWLSAPAWLKAQLERQLTDQLGRRVSVGQLEFKPWSLELTLHDLAIARAQTNGVELPSPQLTVKRIYIDAALQSLLRLAPVVDAITVESPQLNLTHLGQGHYDVDDVLARLTQPAANPSSADAEPARFALYNLSLIQGEVTFTDTLPKQVHQVHQLNFTLPFLSSLPTQRTVLVTPRLAFKLNGSSFDSSAQSTPFAPNRKTDVAFKLSDVDLAPYLAYQPANLPIRLTAAVLNADLNVAFEQTPHNAVTVSGLFKADHVKLVSKNVVKAPQSADLLAFDQLSVQLKRVQPLAQEVHLSQLSLAQPRVLVARDAAGKLNWLSLFVSPKANNVATKKIANNEGNISASIPKGPKPSGWQFSLDQLAVQGAQVQWQDASTRQPSRLNLTGLDLTAQSLAWPVAQSMPFAGHAQLDAATLEFKGAATDQAAQMTLKLAQLPLGLAQPYLSQWLNPKLTGTLNADAGLTWQAATSQQSSAQMSVQLPSLTLDNLALTADKDRRQTLASVKQVAFTNLALDVSRRSATLGRVSVTQPKTSVSRAADGHWMFADWLKPQEPTGVQTKPVPADRPWTYLIRDAALAGGVLTFSDQANPQAVVFDLSDVTLQLQKLTSSDTQPVGLSLSANLRHGRTEPGQLRWRGTAQRQPLQVQGDLTVQRLPLHAFAPYLSDVLNVALMRADTSFKGQVNYAQLPTGERAKLHGDVSVEDFHVNTLAQAPLFTPGEELLTWKALSLRGLDVALVPGAPMQVEVQNTILSDFYAQLVLNQAGRLNLQEVFKTSVAVAALPDVGLPASPLSPNNATESIAIKPVNTSANGQIDPINQAAPLIRFGPVHLQHGRVDFSDRFIKPNYATSLSDLNGKLSAFASQTPEGTVQLADLELSGRAEGTATLEVLGKINPLATPIALDIQGHVRNLELPPLSPYAARYAGYLIERGKFSVDVAYKVQPDGQLTAENKLMLNQLQFGDAVPDAENSLPVKLAVALLSDRHGVIDINLPVTGSLNDPQFRVGPIVFKLIVNLITKALTAPFSLLANALGGGDDELSMVSFVPGTSELSPQAAAGLNKVAQALADRPSLKMTVVGTASLAVEQEAFKQAQLMHLITAERRRVAVLSGAVTTTQAVRDTDPDYPALLKAVYKRADFSKPRNLIGMTKDLPVPDMQTLMLANLPVTESAMKTLAVQRGVVVRDYLAGLKLPTERLFLGAAKAVTPDATWQPRAELNLSQP